MPEIFNGLLRTFIKGAFGFLGGVLQRLKNRQESERRKMEAPLGVDRVNVLGVGVSALNMNEAVDILLKARAQGHVGYVCVTGVHGVIESQRDCELKRIHNRSFLTVPDGTPTVWMGLEQGFMGMGRVYGPDLMLQLMAATSGSGGKDLDRFKEKGLSVKSKEHKGANSKLNHLKPKTELSDSSLIPNHLKPKTVDDSHPLTHFLYGATEETLKKLKTNLEKRFPGVRIVGTYAPPFRPLNEEEEEYLHEMVTECKPDFFWVGLSTPKQEKFMASHDPCLADSSFKSSPLDCGIMLGVGAAFDIHAGNYKDSPEWIKNSGLQWLHRLCKEPRRLWRRYLDIVPTFLWLTGLQVLGIRQYGLDWDRGE